MKKVRRARRVPVKTQLERLVPDKKAKSGEFALKDEFKGVFYPGDEQLNRSNGCCASGAFSPEVLEEEVRVTEGKLRHLDTHRHFVEVEELSTEMVEIVPVFTKTDTDLVGRMATLLWMNPCAVWDIVEKALADDRRTILDVVPQAIARLDGLPLRQVLNQVRKLPYEPRLRALHAMAA